MKKILFILASLFSFAYGQNLQYPTITDSSGNVKTRTVNNGSPFNPGTSTILLRPKSTSSLAGDITFDSDSGRLLVNVGLSKNVKLLTSLDISSGAAITGTDGSITVTGSDVKVALAHSNIFTVAQSSPEHDFPLSGGATPSWYNSNSSNTNFATLSNYPKTGTNVANQVLLIPKGTGSTTTSEIAFFNTDFVADGTNFEYLDVYGIGTGGYNIFSKKGGTGVARKISLGVGAFTTQLVLNTDGTINTSGAVTTGGSLVVGGTIDQGGYSTGSFGLRQGDAVVQSNDANNTFFGSNVQEVSGVPKYIKTQASGIIDIGNTSGILFGVAASGTAGASITYKIPLTIAIDGTMHLSGIPSGTGTPNVLVIGTDSIIRQIAFPSGGSTSSGSCTCTLTNTTNISSSSIQTATYTQVGNIVTVHLGVTISPTATSSTVLTIALPVSTATTSQQEVGLANIGQSTLGAVGIVSGSTAQLAFTAASTAGLATEIIFQYHTN